MNFFCALWQNFGDSIKSDKSPKHSRIFRSTWSVLDWAESARRVSDNSARRVDSPRTRRQSGCSSMNLFVDPLGRCATTAARCITPTLGTANPSGSDPAFPKNLTFDSTGWSSLTHRSRETARTYSNWPSTRALGEPLSSRTYALLKSGFHFDHDFLNEMK